MYFGFIFFIIGMYAFKINDNILQLNNYYFTSSLKTKNFTSKHNKPYYLPVFLHNNLCNVCLMENVQIDNKLFYSYTKVFLYNNGNASKTTLEELKINFVHGYIVGHENDSAVDGFFDDNFYGRILFKDSIFYVTEKAYFLDILKNETEHDSATVVFKYNNTWLSNHHFTDHINLMQSFSYEGNVCSLIILIDNSFYRLVGMNNYKHATAIVLNAVNRANSIFRSTDFDNDGSPDNIGFKIKYIMVMETVKDQEPYILPYSEYPCNSRDFMITVSKLPNFREACLGVVFTAQNFLDNIIGLSYSSTIVHSTGFALSFGGVCMSSYFGSFNVVLITYFHTHRLTDYYTDLSLSHEIGHSFGSQHDDRTCGKGFLMDSKTPKFWTGSTYLFSECSKFQINYVINKRRFCFESDYSEFCGNGIVERREECDCGSYYTCVNSDDCCLPTGAEGCKINRKQGYSCHPSQGLCCDSNCKLRDLSEFDLSCENFQQKCEDNRVMSCGIEGSCKLNYCHSIECTRIGLPECDCPKNHNKKWCQICCSYKGKCVTAFEATQLQIENDKSLLLNLFKKMSSKRHASINFQVFKFCSSGTCVEEYFRVFKSGSFCLLHGKLGYCDSNFSCAIPNEKFSKLPKYSYSCNKIGGVFNNLIIVAVIFLINV